MLNHFKKHILHIWGKASPIIVILLTIIFVVWIVIELYAAATSITREDILFHKEIVIAVITGASLFYIVFTLAKNWEMATATKEAAQSSQQSLQHMRHIREEETSPYVLVYFDIPFGENVIYLVIKNIGKTPARDVEINFDPPLQDTRNRIRGYSPIVNGIPSIAPGQEIKTFFDSFRDYINRGLPRTYNVNLSYSGGFENRRHEELQVSDISMFIGVMMPHHRHFDDLVTSSERIADTLTEIARSNRIRNVTEQEENNSSGNNNDLPSLNEIANIFGVNIVDNQSSENAPESHHSDQDNTIRDNVNE